ncbi:ImmA/IrrE family metallo-endopeptidase [Caballeronia ptereochthonis]|uniref:IrrE N-terminal-like domain-containing protein n=1 Tax=Caballeronia ptereochthonis TaxID=1777144 RepID=A0A158BII4_9BURK|nr:ImmA/IrrE family metallo-endopeptidase [Caballeronia ptereochthonis]SAK69874.1 hypothetical protein AWB83_03310 [Caballeronia ptereochthonis]
MPKMAARYMLSKYWDGRLPVDPFAIARSANVAVEHEADMEDAFGRFEIVNGRPHIYINPDEPGMRQRFVLAHELGHFALKHGRHFVDTSREFAPVQLDEIENQANRFAMELLIPGFAVNILIEKRNITNFIRLTDAFAVSQLAMKLRLKKLRWL